MKWMLAALFCTLSGAAAAEDSPHMAPAKIDSSPGVKVSQVRSPDASVLSILLEGLEVTSRSGDCHTKILTANIPIESARPTSLHMDVRGFMRTADKERAACTLWVNDKGISTWNVTEDFLVSAQVQIPAGRQSKFVATVHVSCTSADMIADSTAIVEAIDIALKTD